MSEGQGPADERAPTRGDAEFRAVVERYDDRPDQCTIFPAAASDDERMVTWVTAQGDSFVDLENLE